MPPDLFRGHRHALAERGVPVLRNSAPVASRSEDPPFRDRHEPGLRRRIGFNGLSPLQRHSSGLTAGPLLCWKRATPDTRSPQREAEFILGKVHSQLVTLLQGSSIVICCVAKIDDETHGPCTVRDRNIDGGCFVSRGNGHFLTLSLRDLGGTQRHPLVMDALLLIKQSRKSSASHLGLRQPGDQATFCPGSGVCRAGP